MTDTAPTRTLVIEREMPHPPEKIWRALTQSSLMEEWLMSNDFKPVVGHRFQFRAKPAPNWSGIIESEVLLVEPPRAPLLLMGCIGPGKRRRLDVDRDRDRHTHSYGAIRLRRRSGCRLQGRHLRMAEVHWKSRACRRRVKLTMKTKSILYA